MPALKYESYARFESDLKNARIDPSIRAVIYDPESWSYTPDPEKRDPRTYVRLFAQLAHRYGYYAITAPSRDLMQVPGAVCGKISGETLSAAFVRCNVAGAAAQYVDAYEVQSQVHENDPARFRWFVQITGIQAHAANPNVVFFAGLSTSPSNYVATAEMLYQAHKAVEDLVAGYCFTISAPEVGIAEEFLRLLIP